MREIKFRAWYENSKQMIEDVPVYKNKHYAMGDSTIPELFECVLMQYTGLKDRAGNELFDGDIVELGTNDRIKANRLLKCVIKWNEDRWSAFAVNSTHPVPFGRSIKDTEKVQLLGNIYENPNLLKK